ncbi:hypothetical protein [Tabrizicola sp.]|uniref:hypothetical protein n=1 Tax=Tabrizicola sp. TaxID=2005166 RepID=UPI001A50A972|nr:hypothetical protein [Tabrizicola sp.]MBL9075439.1 hypothetical protein [Tabrizicola sp.]
MRAFLVLLLSVTPALAEPLVTAEEFDALTLGRTMTWSEFGAVYGVEQYLPGRKVRWTVLGDDCKTGHWYQDGTAICFQYEDDIAPDCWEITASGPDLLARYTTNPPEADPVIVTETTEPLACFGPEVGA